MHYQYVVKICWKAFRELKQDLKRTQWLRGFGWTGGVIWLFGLMASAICIGIATLTSTDTACQPDGSFRLHPETYSMWSSSGFFQITLGGGHLSFAVAKLIDIVWDIGVGRGGQFLLAIMSWRVFAKYIATCMESEPVTYQVFRTVFLEKEASLISTYRTIKSFIWHRRLQSKIAMIFMVAAMLFILAFPTIVSAMSGYDSNVASYLPDRNDNLIRFDNFSRVLYVIHDGWRINQDGDYWITDETMFPENSVSAYVIAHGLGGTKNESTRFDDWSTGKNITLKAPALNISAYRSDDLTLGGQNSSGVLNMSWVRENQTFDRTYIEESGTCQTTGDYQWGFSFLQLFVCIILLLAWTIGIYTMWLRTHLTMELRRRHSDDISGEHRAILELATAMQTELDIEDTEFSMLREKQLKERIDKELQGGTISYAYPKAELDSYNVRQGLGAWFKKEKWWCLAMIFTSILVSTFWMIPVLEFRIIWMWSPSIWFGQFLAFRIGTTTASRILIIFIFSLIGLIIVASLAMR